MSNHMQTLRPKVALVTTAIGRCGSSATMGLLNVMNFSMGCHNDFMPASAMNPKGFFELRAQEHLLRKIYPDHYPGITNAPTDNEIAVAVDTWGEKFARMARTEFAAGVPRALKAPRGLTLPFWNNLCGAYDVRLLVMHRPHGDHIRSINKIWKNSNDLTMREGGTDLIKQQFGVWFAFLHTQLKATPFPKMAVDFNALIKDPLETARSIASFLEVAAPDPDLITDWIDRSLVNRARNVMPIAHISPTACAA